MKTRLFLFLTVLVIFVLGLTACAPAISGSEGGAGSSTTATQAVPDVGTVITQVATDALPLATQAAGAGEAVANCAGVDSQQLVKDGQAVYADNCASCHGEQAEGQGDFPALAGNQDVTVENAASLVTKYLSVDAHPKDVTAVDLAAALSYVRGSFGNTATAVCPADIQIPAAP